MVLPGATLKKSRQTEENGTGCSVGFLLPYESRNYKNRAILLPWGLFSWVEPFLRSHHQAQLP